MSFSKLGPFTPGTVTRPNSPDALVVMLDTASATLAPETPDGILIEGILDSIRFIYSIGKFFPELNATK
jgi:hypothetical protein